MQFNVEYRDPVRDLGGLCECFINEDWENQAACDYHVHEHFELLNILSGSFELTTISHTSILHPGDVVLIHPMEPHQVRNLNSGKNAHLVLKFTPNALYSVNQPLFEMKYISPYIRFSERHIYIYTAEQLHGSRLDELLRSILEERQREEYGYEMALRAYVCQVLLWFIRDWHRNRTAQPVDERSLIRLQTALAYIDSHLDGELHAQDVAEALGMGLSTFSRFFSTAAGISFPAYVRSRRLSRAALLLSDSNLSIADVALETGFNTASYLIYCFRSQYGVTPSQFRRMYTASDEGKDAALC